jgi:hypothetical protein
LTTGVVQGVRLRDPERASVIEATEDIESETHIGNGRVSTHREKCLFKIEQTGRRIDE